ncbi:MAG: signal peptide peptidase SppA [Terrimonas sp.]|nr:signal peptide peptidase SppA [Terrimonas sp.]
MRSFFKIFFASFLALLVFSLIAFFLLITFIGGLASKDRPTVNPRSVLVLNLGQDYREQSRESPFSGFADNDELDVPGLYDVIRLIRKAKNDKNIAGIYITANNNPNGFAASEEIRQALEDFKESKKFVIAYGDIITQKAYYVATAADEIYLNPRGFFQWSGFAVDFAFFKGTLDKLDIRPQIFYAGKFKSATEPFRTDKMTDANKLQTMDWLGDLYGYFLQTVADSRKLDTVVLRELAQSGKVQEPEDALQNKLVDGLKYDDEMKEQLKGKMGLGKYDKMEFVSINKYSKTGGFKKFTGDKIAVIYAEGDIVDGKGNENNIGSEPYQQLIRKARLDRNIKAIVLRVNSGGGSTLASELIWRELSLAREEKPVVVSFGDVAASGGYYISCAADSIFASPVTITGSIGVFSIIPNMGSFFQNKLGITFDGVKTSPFADNPSVTRPMTDAEQKMMQTSINNIYTDFKTRVANGRHIDTAVVESIAQGRVWSGMKALQHGLIDRFGGLERAITSAATLAQLTDYRVKEYPEPRSFFDKIFNAAAPLNINEAIEKEIGKDNYLWYKEMISVRQMMNQPQARLPFQFFIH